MIGKQAKRLQVDDGHNSHYTRAFLEYARLHRIHILCYPSHTTHIYQGLDVVIFSALKRRWTDARDTYERQYGRKVDKSNFLSVYATAREEAFTSGNIIAAFRKTGVVPFNPDMITEDMMAPSRTSSSQSILPLTQQSPIRVMVDMIHRQLARELVAEEEENREDQDSDEGPPTTEVNSPILVAIEELQLTLGRHLVTKTPPRSTHKIPKFTPYTISPLKMRRQSDLIDDELLLTERETKLLNAWQNAEQRDEHRKQAMIEMQGTVILQDMYCQTVQNHLWARAERESQKKRGFGGWDAKTPGSRQLLCSC